MTALHTETDERARRLAKLDDLRTRGIDPYPASFARDHTTADVRGRFAALGPDARADASVRVAGRVMLIRRHGGLIFATLHDQTGELQLLAARGTDAFAALETLDRGDWVGAAGAVMTTHTGELTVELTELELLSKAVRPLPDKHHGLADPEVRVRERHLDLIANPAARRTFDVRSAVVAAVRATLAERGFTEVETPVLEAHAGGAAARPFITHHNALDTDRYLRIALELPLKRLVVGGFERVFEIGRVFRNEGLDATHNPEFTLLEAYQALADYRDMMELVETIVSRAAIAATGTTVVSIGGREIDLAPPWRRATMAELILEHSGETMHPSMGVEAARAVCERVGIAYEAGWGPGKLMAEVYEAVAEDTLIEPTFVLDHPREVSPLARSHRDDPLLTERFEAIVGGRELANAYSELNDPVDQRERFEAEGFVDEDYVRALESGLPPTGGLGIGIDRLVMLISGAPTIRDVVLFPALRPERTAVELPAVVKADDDPVAGIDAVTRPRAPMVLAGLTALSGVALLTHHGGVVASVVIGFVLLLLAAPLRGGKRRAWGAAVALFGAAVVFRRADVEVFTPAVAMLVALVWNRDAFVAKPDPGSARTLAWFVPAWVAASVVFGVAALHQSLGDALLGLAGMGDAGRFASDTLLALGLTGLAVSALLAFRAVRSSGSSDLTRARELVLKHGEGTLDYFALRPDKRHFFSEDGSAMLAYTVRGGHALVSGDPIGPREAHVRVVNEFVTAAHSEGRRVAFLGARERDLGMYRSHGFRSVYLGDEAVVHCDRFSLEGAAMKSVRSAVARVGRECSFELLREPEASPALRDQLNALRERWRDGADERGFTMELGGGVTGEDPELLLALALAPDGRPLGYLRLVPCFGDEPGWSLDLMNHDPSAPNGMIEYLVAMTAQELGARGYKRLSLNFATWGRLFAEDASLSFAERAQKRVAEVLSPYFQITSLRTFNAKFDPEWVPRSIIVEDVDDLPKVGLLYASVEGFLTLPRLGR
ncbi:lysine--tRNA ligase [Solirubrobacter phytolaccae]|uniref:Lysine--tRNA ligase n=1 Tax=Solirubrobacter phytolaccae TaxID=1404360 RepID=A0A9X3NH60_9ACTN|nr:lysine--tRNA ligase [Solirubrobacter phytolaccae]MDA0185002.1 lysine--tRNA ligase [Solirubrobacter phytolaccae]